LSVAPTIVGCGRSHFGRLILVAYEIKRPAEFCFGVFLPKLGTLSGGDCKTQDEAWTAFRCSSGFCITSSIGTDWQPKAGFRTSVVSGISTASVTAVEVIGGRAARRHQSAATLGAISGPLAEKFGQSEPFVVFGAALPCVAAKAVTAEATSGTERLTATPSRYPELFKHPCHPPSPPKPPQ
jgi:hypothetical protein